MTVIVERTTHVVVRTTNDPHVIARYAARCDVYDVRPLDSGLMA